jgi:hypothetical protein
MGVLGECWVRWIRVRVQSPAALTRREFVLVSFSGSGAVVAVVVAVSSSVVVVVGADGKMAKGCHSHNGLSDILIKLILGVLCVKCRRMVCGERTSGVKVHLRRRSQGYTSSAVMRMRFQNVGVWMRMATNDFCVVVSVVEEMDIHV